MYRSEDSRSKHFADLMVNADDGSETKAEVDNLIYPHKRCARKKQRRCLPLDLLFDILLHFPAHVIQEVMTRVCKDWNAIISRKEFISHHLQNSTPGIIIMEEYKPAYGIYVEIRRGCLEICKFDCRDYYLCWENANGLVLTTPLNEGVHGVLSIMNPLGPDKTRGTSSTRWTSNSHGNFSICRGFHEV